MYNKFWFSGAVTEQLTCDFKGARLRGEGTNLEKGANCRQVRLVDFFQGVSFRWGASVPGVRGGEHAEAGSRAPRVLFQLLTGWSRQALWILIKSVTRRLSLCERPWQQVNHTDGIWGLFILCQVCLFVCFGLSKTQYTSFHRSPFWFCTMRCKRPRCFLKWEFLGRSSKICSSSLPCLSLQGKTPNLAWQTEGG